MENNNPDDPMIISDDESKEEQKQPSSDLDLLSDNIEEIEKLFNFASNSWRKNYNKNVISIYSDDDFEDEGTQLAIQLSLYNNHYPLIEDKKKKGVARSNSVTSTPYYYYSPMTFNRFEKGSTSSLPACPICSDVLPKDPTVAPICRHAFCTDCIKEYVGVKLNEDIHEVLCPVLGCKVVFRAGFVMENIPTLEVFDRWQLARIEGSVLALTQRIDCPLEGCGGSMVDDEKGYLIRACTCCWGLFCVNCRVQWHMGMTCREHREWMEMERQRVERERRRAEMERWRGEFLELFCEELQKRVEEEAVVVLRPQVRSPALGVRFILRKPVHLVGLNGRKLILYI